MDDVLLDERRQARVYGEFGALWLGEPDAKTYGTCDRCGSARRVRRRVLEGNHVTWDSICSNEMCPVTPS